MDIKKFLRGLFMPVIKKFLIHEITACDLREFLSDLPKTTIDLSNVIPNLPPVISNALGKIEIDWADLAKSIPDEWLEKLKAAVIEQIDRL